MGLRMKPRGPDGRLAGARDPISSDTDTVLPWSGCRADGTKRPRAGNSFVFSFFTCHGTQDAALRYFVSGTAS